MIGNDVTSLEETGSDPEVASLNRKSPGSGCRRFVSQVLGTLSSYKALTHRRWQPCDWKSLT